jgi:F-type H+-transporting ATPase subunit gamma
MPSLRQIRRRIRSVQNTAKITRAMEMVAAVKMRRAQQSALATRPYAEKMGGLLADLAAMPPEDPGQVHPLLQRREVRRVTVVHVTPDRGLCGALPGALNRHVGGFALESSVPVTIVAVGRKGRDFMVRYGRDVRAVFTGLGERPSLLDIAPIARLVIDDFTAGATDAVHVAYGQFVNTMVQRPALQRLLPVEPTPLPPGQAVGYIYEPRGLMLLDALLPRYVEMELYHAILEANASEQSARMVAMRSATDNAKELVQDLTLTANKVRQDNITEELLDIIGGTLTAR